MGRVPPTVMAGLEEMAALKASVAARSANVQFGGSNASLAQRPRRNRKSPIIREAHRENFLTAAHFVLPLFVHAGEEDIPVQSLPGRSRLSLSGMMKEVEAAIADGVHMIEVFPAVDDSLKTEDAAESYNPNGLVQVAVRMLKEKWPRLVVVTDVALDPYSADGHDGLVDDRGVILNDETVEILCQQAVSHAMAGADIIAPSDMMDGRVAAIRHALDQHGFTEVTILSYTAKYASALYGPFREALDSAPREAGAKPVPAHKRSYQMDPANRREAVRECMLDQEEGVDIMMVKPAVPYLDVIMALKQNSSLPIAAYHVSGEYAMIKAASINGWIDEKAVVLEQLMSIRRAGADMIFTYFAREAAQWLKEESGKSSFDMRF